MYFYCFYGEDDSFLIHLKLRRFLTAFCVGAALSLSGVILQAVLKNPLADPFILGVAGASGFGITLALFTGLYVFINPVFIGFIISLGTVFFVVKVSSSKNKLSLYSAILTGFVFNSVYYSLIL